MNAQQIVVEFYRAIERATGRGSVDKARIAARAFGAKFTNAEASRWLEPFVKAADGFADRQRTGKRTGNQAQNGRTAEGSNGRVDGLTRDNCIPSKDLELLATPVQQSLVDLPAAPSPAPKPRKKAERQFDFNAPENRLAKEFFATIRAAISAEIRGISWTEWGKRNKRYVLDMDRAGVTLDEMVTAWEAKSRSLGGACRNLKFVQDYIAKGNVVRGPWQRDDDDFSDIPDDGIASILDLQGEA